MGLECTVQQGKMRGKEEDRVWRREGEPTPNRCKERSPTPTGHIPSPTPPKATSNREDPGTGVARTSRWAGRGGGHGAWDSQVGFSPFHLSPSHRQTPKTEDLSAGASTEVPTARRGEGEAAFNLFEVVRFCD